MTKTAIVTDTTACIPAEKVAGYGIEIVPVPLVIDGKVYRDSIDITPTQFYELLRNAKKTPTTSASSPEPFVEAFQRASQKADNILCFSEPVKFSAMFASANIARQTAAGILPGEHIEVIECMTAAAGTGLVVLEAARAAALDKTIEEVKNTVAAMMPKVHLYATLDTLQYLVKGGRVPQAAAFINSILSIKPIFALNRAGAHIVSLPRTMKNAIDRMFRLVEEVAKDGKPLHAAIMHAAAVDNATALKERIVSRFNCKEVYITEFTPVMGAHTGPGLVGVTFWAEG